MERDDNSRKRFQLLLANEIVQDALLAGASLDPVIDFVLESARVWRDRQLLTVHRSCVKGARCSFGFFPRRPAYFTIGARHLFQTPDWRGYRMP